MAESEGSIKGSSWVVEGCVVPDDIIQHILGMLQARDVCQLQLCSRFWHIWCSSDDLWEYVFCRRWPTSGLARTVDCARKKIDCLCVVGRTCNQTNVMRHPQEGWKEAYKRIHTEMAIKSRAVGEIVNRLSRQESVEVNDYHKAMALLCALGFDYQDVVVNLFKPTLSVLVNLIALHYCLFHLGIEGKHVREALKSSQIATRQICLRWWSLGSWANGYRKSDDIQVKTTCLQSLVDPEGQVVLDVIDRGTRYEVMRVQISADFRRSAWVSRVMHSQR